MTKHPWWHEDTHTRTEFAKGYHQADISRLSGCLRAVDARLEDSYASPSTVTARLNELMRIWRKELDSHLEASQDPRIPMLRFVLSRILPTDGIPDDETLRMMLVSWDRADQREPVL